MTNSEVLPFPSKMDSSAPAAGKEKVDPIVGSTVDNPVSRSIRELVELSENSEDIRAGLAACGVPRRVINVLIELGVQKQQDRLCEAIDSALEQAEDRHGAGSLERSVIEDQVTRLVRIEQDTDHSRQVARGLGLDPRALAIVSQLIQANPGDRGERAINQLIAYARAAGISLDDVPQMSAELMAPPPSVLPRISRDVDKDSNNGWYGLWRDICIGAVIGLVLITVLI